MRAAAAAEGLELEPSWNSQSGYKGVRTGIHKGRYTVELRRYGTHPEKRYLGSFATAEEAALQYARYMGAERASGRAAATSGAVTSDDCRFLTPGNTL